MTDSCELGRSSAAELLSTTLIDFNYEAVNNANASLWHLQSIGDFKWDIIVETLYNQLSVLLVLLFLLILHAALRSDIFYQLNHIADLRDY